MTIKITKNHTKCLLTWPRKIKKFRHSGLEEAGEYSNENLTFKHLRNKGFIKRLYDTRNKSYDKMMSLEGDFAKKIQNFCFSKEKVKRKWI